RYAPIVGVGKPPALPARLARRDFKILWGGFPPGPRGPPRRFRSTARPHPTPPRRSEAFVSSRDDIFRTYAVGVLAGAREPLAPRTFFFYPPVAAKPPQVGRKRRFFGGLCPPKLPIASLLILSSNWYAIFQIHALRAAFCLLG